MLASSSDHYARVLDEYLENISQQDRSFANLYSSAMEPPSLMSFLLTVLRNAFYENMTWLISLVRSPPPEVYLSAEEIISRSTHKRAHLPIPPRFLEVFARLRGIPLDNVLCFLDQQDIFRMQMAHRDFNIHVRNVRANFPIREVRSGDFSLLADGDVRVYRRRSKIVVNHEQFSKSLRTVTFRALMIQQFGKVQATSYHIPEIRCWKLDIRIHDPIEIEDQQELTKLFEQIIVNQSIRCVNLIARAHGDPDEVQNRLDAIVARGQHLIQKLTNIVVLDPD